MTQNMAYGVDLGWMTQLEQMGYSWVDENGQRVDPILQCKNMGATAVRLRIFVNPPAEAFWQKKVDERCMLGFCDAESVMRTSERVKDLGMDLMLDFHYSDHFADPTLQDIPDEWREDDSVALAERVYTHTRETLLLFQSHHISPQWVQVGNEINHGIMWPKGSLEEHPKELVHYLNIGYDAVKEVFPECQVVTHLAGIHDESWCVPFLDNFLAQGGKTDIFGFSYYPYWAEFHSEKKCLIGWLTAYQAKCDKPVLIAEVGGDDQNEQETYDLICDCMDAVQQVPNEMGRGVFYWEPEACRDILPDGYPLCASRLVGDHVLQFNKGLTAYGRA